MFTDWLASARKNAIRLGLGESRIGFVFKNDPDDNEVLAPLSETYSVSLKNNPVHKYMNGQEQMPAMVAVNRGHWYKSQAIFGGPNWYESRRTPGQYFPHRGKDLRPEGNLRDLHEIDAEKSVVLVGTRSWDQTITRWANRLFDADHVMQRGGLFTSVIPPQIVCSLPTEQSRDWLQLRQGMELDMLVERIVNLKRYRVYLMADKICAPINGVARLMEDGKVEFKGVETDGRSYSHVENTQLLSLQLQNFVSSVFGMPVRTDLFPLVGKNETPVLAGQAMFTPIAEQAKVPNKRWTISELKRLPCYAALQHIAVLSAVMDIGNHQVIDAELAYCDKESNVFVHMGSNFPRVQRVLPNVEALKFESPSIMLDMYNVAHREAIRHNKAKWKKRGVISPATVLTK